LESVTPAPAFATGKPYRPFGAALQGTDTPPPNGAGVNSLGLQQATGQVEKKSKFGGMGNTVIDERSRRVISANQTCRWHTLLLAVLALVLVSFLSQLLPTCT